MARTALIALVAAAALLPLTAHADPVTIVYNVLYAVGATASTAAAFAASYGALINFVVAVGAIAYSNSSAKRAQRKAAAAARAEYNSSLEDRFSTVLSTAAPRVTVYGRTYVGGAIVAMLTSNRPPYRTPTGDPLYAYGNPYAQYPASAFGGTDHGKATDALRHLVVVLAAHEIEAVEGIRIDGSELGPLDANGFPTTGDFYKVRTGVQHQSLVVSGGVATTSMPVKRLIRARGGNVIGGTAEVSATASGTTITVSTPGVAFLSVTYEYEIPRASVNVRVHLGGDDQAADAYLQSAVPGWTADHRLRGLAYLVVTLDLNEKRFQGGPPAIQALVKGKKIYDPRSGLTAWSDNPALCTADFLNSPDWAGSTLVQILPAELAAAANACDAEFFTEEQNPGGSLLRYTCNGSYSSADSPEGVLSALVDSMAGSAFVTNGWKLLPGTWTMPVASLTDADADGPVQVTQVAQSWESLVNSVRGQFSQAGEAIAKDITPYSNQTLVDSDGEELWEDMSFQFTNSDLRCTQLARIQVETSRNGLTLRWPVRLAHVWIEPGDRVLVTLADLNIVNKPFRVTEWGFSLNTPVVLTLQEDSEEAYDLEDQVEQDATPNSSLPNPHTVAKPGSVTLSTGTSELSVGADGTVRAGVRVTWTGFEALGGAAWATVQHRVLTDGAAYQTAKVAADTGNLILSGYTEGQDVLVRVRFETAVADSDWVSAVALVEGKLAAPSNVPSAAVSVTETGVTLRWDRVSDPDVLEYEVRLTNTDFGTPGYVFRGAALSAAVDPAAGGVARTWYVRARDTTGHYSAASATASLTITPSVEVSNLAHDFYDTSLTSAEVTLRWNQATQATGVAGYEVSYGAISTVTSSTSVKLPADWVGSRTFTIKVIDRYGNRSPGVNYPVTKLAPNPVTGLRAQVIDNNVLLFWTLPARTTLPLAHAEIRKGSTFVSSTVVGTKDGEFTTLQELAAGVYTYWVTVKDTDGVESEARSVTVNVARPPDFVLSVDYESPLLGTLSSALKQTSGVLLPVNTTETFAQHFTSRSWTSPQDQISAGFPIYAQPGVASGYYEETYDYGTTLASTQVTVTPAGQAVSGNPTVSVTLSVSSDGVSFTDYVGVTQVFAVNVRFVRVRVTVTQASSGDLYNLTALGIVLSSKQVTDGGSQAVSNSDTQGTVVNFNREFVDVSAIIPTAAGASARTCTYVLRDTVGAGTYSVASGVLTVNETGHNLVAGQRVRLYFGSGSATSGIYTIASVPSANTFTAATGDSNTSGVVSSYPNSFRAYLFDATGARVSGDISWTARGY